MVAPTARDRRPACATAADGIVKTFQTVEQVLAKSFSFDRGFEGRRSWRRSPRTSAWQAASSAAEALEAMILQHAQQFALRFQRDLADFVQKTVCPPHTVPNLPDVAAVGPIGKRAFFRGQNQFAFEQLLRKVSAVDLQERCSGNGGCADGGPERLLPCQCRSPPGSVTDSSHRWPRQPDAQQDVHASHRSGPTIRQSSSSLPSVRRRPPCEAERDGDPSRSLAEVAAANLGKKLGVNRSAW